jgi:hypothetical protein
LQTREADSFAPAARESAGQRQRNRRREGLATTKSDCTSPCFQKQLLRSDRQVADAPPRGMAVC